MTVFGILARNLTGSNFNLGIRSRSKNVIRRTVGFLEESPLTLGSLVAARNPSGLFKSQTALGSGG